MRTRPDATKEEPIHSSPALGNSRFKINPDCVLQVRLQGGSASRGMHSAGKHIKRTITGTPRRPRVISYHTKVPQTALRPRRLRTSVAGESRVNRDQAHRDGPTSDACARQANGVVLCKRGGRRTARSPECE